MSSGCTQNKKFRLLEIYEKLNKGEVLSKKELAEKYGVTEKSIERDMRDLKNYCSNENKGKLECNSKTNKYELVKKSNKVWFTNQEVLALSKILLESRAFNKVELNQLIDKLLLQVTPADRKSIKKIIDSEQFYYEPLKHGQPLLEKIWNLSECIKQQQIIEMDYKRQDGSINRRKVKPVAIMFSEYYFYLVCYMAETEIDHPTIFRIDRISNIVKTSEKFKVNHIERFNDGEFRKRIQFMYGGELKRVKFRYKGPSDEAVLDRLPTAKSTKESDGVWLFEAESYGDGINMWLKSQGERVTILDKK